MNPPVIGQSTETLALERWRKRCEKAGFVLLWEPVTLRAEPREPDSREAITRALVR